MSTLPQFIKYASEDNTGVLTSLITLTQQHGESLVKFFLEQVPERGEALWQRFLGFKKTQSSGVQIGFDTFFEHVISQSFPKMLYPKECSLDPMTQSLLAEKVQAAVGTIAKTNEDVLQIYTGCGPAYNLTRSVVCKGCVKSGCIHYLPFNSGYNKKYPKPKKKW